MARIWLQRRGSRKTCFCPFHENTKTPAFSVFNDGKAWKCYTGCGKGSVIDFLARSERDSARKKHARRSLRRAGANSLNCFKFLRRKYMPRVPKRKRRHRSGSGGRLRDSYAGGDLSHCEAARAFRRGCFPCDGARLAILRSFQEGRAWIITDSRRRNAQARRLDGQSWERLGAKAWTLPGSEAAWPIGLREVSSFPAIALVEGGPIYWEHFISFGARGLKARLHP